MKYYFIKLKFDSWYKINTNYISNIIIECK